jgi:hypothetical protein
MRRLKEIGVISTLISMLGLGYSAGCDGKALPLQIGGYSTGRDAGTDAARGNTAKPATNNHTNSICESLNAPAGMCAMYSSKELLSSNSACTADDLVYSTAMGERLQIVDGSQSDGYHRGARRAYAGRILIEGPARCKGEKINATIEFKLTQDDQTRLKEQYEEYKRQNIANIVVENTPANLAGKSLADYFIPTRGEVIRISFREGESYKFEQRSYTKNKKRKRRPAAPAHDTVRVTGMFDYCIKTQNGVKHEMKLNTKTRTTEVVPVKNSNAQQCATRKGWMHYTGKRQGSL